MADLEGQGGKLEISQTEGGHEQLLLPDVGDFRKKFHDKVTGKVGDDVDFGGHA